MKKLRVFQKIKSTRKQFLYIVTTLLVTIFSTPNFVFASPTFSNFSTASGYTGAYQTTVAGGSFWYLQSTGPSGRVDIGNATTSGSITNYNIQVLSGIPALYLNSLITGPDGNVWFNGTVGTAGYTGRLNISTGVVTVYANNAPGFVVSGYLSNLVAGSDGKLWYLVKSVASSTNYTYVVKVDPTTGANTVVRDFDAYSSFSNIARSPDGKIWMVNKYRYDRSVHVIDPLMGTGSVGSYQMPAFPVAPAYSNQNYLDRSIVAGGDGNMWFTDSNGATSKRYRLTTSGTFTEYTTLMAGMYPTTPVAGLGGETWFLHDVSGVRKIARMDTLGNVIDYIVPGANVIGVGSLVLGPDGALWFSYKDSGGVKMGRLVIEPTNQTISFTSTAPTSANLDSPTYIPSASATSGLPVTITVDSSSSSICSIDGAGKVSYQAPGTCILNANQEGNVDYNPAPQVQQSFTVLPVNADTSVALNCPTTASVNNSVTCTITITNSGPAAAENASLTALFPSSLTNASLSGGGTLTGQYITWSVPSIASGDSVTLTLSATASAAGKARISAALLQTSPDPNNSNNLVDATIGIS